MKKNSRRTTNFAIILYLVEKKCIKIALSQLLPKIKEQFKSKEKIFINSSTKKPFKSEKNLTYSVFASVYRNKSFKIEKNERTKEKYISLNQENALNYLKKMYKKYINENSDIASISSERSGDRSAYQSEKKDIAYKLLGNKTQRKKQRKKHKLKELSVDSSVDSSIDSIDSDFREKEKGLSAYKRLKANLTAKPGNDINNMNMIFNKDFSFLGKDTDTEFTPNFQAEIDNSINALKETPI